MVPSIEAKSSPATTYDQRSRFDIHVIDSVFGRDSDLYSDVLGISPNATQKEIRAAFVVLRDEFFQFQSQVMEGNLVVTEGQLEFAKRRMDAVVAAFRILHDPNLRAFYDKARYKRSKTRSKVVAKDLNDPVEQAVYRALENRNTKRACPAFPRRTSMMGCSPLQSSSGASTTDESSDGEGSLAHSPKKPTSQDRYFTADRNKPTSGDEKPFPDGSEEWRNAHLPKNRTSRGRPSKRTESHAKHYIMEEQTPRRRGKRHSMSHSWSMFDADSDSASVHSQDIGASRNYYMEKSPRHDNISTIATANEDITLDDGDNYSDDGSITRSEHRTADQSGNISVADSSIADSTVFNPACGYEDDTTVPEEDLGDLCCSSERRVTKNRGFVAKTHALILACKWEIKGSFNDMVTAFDQVLNAFTLQENDIKAVTSRIDKASKQLRG